MPISDQWWMNKKDSVSSDVFSLTKFLEDSQLSHRGEELLRYARLYGNMPILGFDAQSYTKMESSNARHRVTLNVIHSMCDTVQAKITKNRPKPEFLTSGGDWSVRRRAQKLTKFIEGQFRDAEVYRKARMVFLDATIFGTGVMKIYKENHNIICERILPSEIFVDDREAVNGAPVQLHQRKYIHKDILKEMFPGNNDAIDGQSEAEDSTAMGYAMSSARSSGMVKVIESWHLPSNVGAKDGRHTICIQDRCLFDEKWTKGYFPFCFIHWNEPLVGFWGQGIAEQLMGLQIEINKLLRTIQMAMHLTSIPKVFVNAQSKIVKSHINNEIGGIITYSGEKPQYTDVSTVSPDLFKQVDNLYNRAFEIVGISQLSAQSKKPSGLDAAVALREFNDIETERFIAVGQRYEEFFLKVSEQMIELIKEIADESDGFEVDVPVKGKRFLQTIAWDDIDLDEDKYIMQVFPVSSLPSRPAGRLQTVQEMMQAGLIDPAQGFRLLDFPDLEAESTLRNANLEDIDHVIELMMDTGAYLPPEPFQDLQLGIERMQMAYLTFKQEFAPEDRLELLRLWIEDASSLANPPLPPLPVEGAVPPNGALAVPEQAPTSELLPLGGAETVG